MKYLKLGVLWFVVIFLLLALVGPILGWISNDQTSTLPILTNALFAAVCGSSLAYASYYGDRHPIEEFADEFLN